MRTYLDTRRNIPVYTYARTYTRKHTFMYTQVPWSFGVGMALVCGEYGVRIMYISSRHSADGWKYGAYATGNWRDGARSGGRRHALPPRAARGQASRPRDADLPRGPHLLRQAGAGLGLRHQAGQVLVPGSLASSDDADLAAPRASFNDDFGVSPSAVLAEPPRKRRRLRGDAN